MRVMFEGKNPGMETGKRSVGQKADEMFILANDAFKFAAFVLNHVAHEAAMVFVFIFRRRLDARADLPGNDGRCNELRMRMNER